MNTTTAQLTTANPNLDGTGTLVNLVTGAIDGTTIQSIRITAPGTTTAGMIRFFLYDGTNNRLLDEVNVSAVVPSATQRAFATNAAVSVFLEQNQILKASTEKSETFNVITTYTDL
jgi:hypothetical protein